MVDGTFQHGLPAYIHRDVVYWACEAGGTFWDVRVVDRVVKL